MRRHDRLAAPMRRHRFFVPDAAGARAGAVVPLSEEESAHARRVLRLAAGAAIELFDGAGASWEAELVDGARPPRFDARLVAPIAAAAVESPLPLWAAVALTKADAFELVLEKAVELGVARCLPVVAERSVVRLDETRAASRAERWRRIVVGATKQCERARLMEVAPLVTLADLPAALPPGARVVLLAERTADAAGLVSLFRALPATSASVDQPLVLLTGPEGGWSPGEIDFARTRDWKLASLGPRILRAETACLAALALAQGLLGDLDR